MAVGVLLVGGVLVLGQRGYGGLQDFSEVELIGHSPKARSGAGDVTFFHISPHDAVNASLRLAREWRPDIIHLHTAWLWSVAEAIREQIGTPLVLTVHSLDRVEYEVGGFASRWEIQDMVIRQADRVIAISHSEKNLLVQYLPEVGPKIHIVGNGIEDSVTAREAACKDRSSQSPLVLYTGRFVDRKGIRELISAIPLVLEQAPATRFVLVGGYGGGAEIERDWLTEALRRHHSQVHFTGWLEPDGVAEWYRRADVLVVPSWYEPFGMVILEGMLYGLPIAASNLGGPAEILEHGRTSLLFAPKDVEALAGALLRLVTDVGLRLRIGTAAAIEVRRQWLWPRIVEMIRSVYQELVADHPNRRIGDPLSCSV
jgi:glycogen synthase